jgi:hypothetical protein
MSTAIFLITFVAFVGRIIMSASALRNWLMAFALSILAAAICVLPTMAGLSLDGPVERLHGALGLILVLLLCALMFALGYVIPTLLTHAERSRRWMRLTFLIAVIATISTANLWLMEGRLGLAEPFIIPGQWFTVGVLWYLIVTARFFEDSDDEPRLEKRRL